MIRLIDLTFEYSDQMPTYSKEEIAKLILTHNIEKQGYVMHKLETYLHAGTHIDVPMHLINDNRYVSDFSLDCFIGGGCILDVRGQEVINYNSIYEKIVDEEAIVLLYTGHDKYWGKQEYYRKYPKIDMELATFFVKKKIKMLCLDTPSPDYFPFEIHKLLLNNNIIIAECLTNIKQLLNYSNFEIMAFPLKIKAEASLVRVVAKAFN